MRIVFMGTPDFAAVPLELLVTNQFKVVAVYTQPDREAGRGRTLVAPPVKSVALRYEIPVCQPVNLKSPVEIEKLATLKPDIIVVAAFGQILSQAVLEIPRYGCLNIHPSLLPRYRGISPVAAAILHGDVFAGVSIMVLDKGVDTGPVLIQAQTGITEWDITGSLTEKLSLVGAQLLLEILPRWISGRVKLQAQDSSLATYTGMIGKEEGMIDWNLPATELWRQVRAYQPWPGSYTRWRGKQLKIVEVVPLEGQSDMPGRVVVPAGKVGFGVMTGAGILGIIRVQMEGKRSMTAEEFLRGQRQLPGAILPCD